MSRACSISVRRLYGKARVCRMWGIPRSTHYARLEAVQRPTGPFRYPHAYPCLPILN
ncbi:hypothetical protein SAMN02746041_00002 [Desulfacinum hydrothermale DSM 13146]|uniref:Uncharacterized protein n=1 Tax=Desulfacinum hydrothermale DSM 13146 TaxID=1121390 RepID=A0A1W1WWT8_9BACT|nr:hypothetical protein SAMN02746041_00002 [Desulfacinum hydrothermale DSM 13146]